METDIPKEDITNAPNGAKIDIMFFNNGWNDRNEVLIASIGENAASCKWMHEKNGYQYAFYNQVLSFFIIITNAFLSAQTLFPKSDSFTLIQQIVIYIVTTLSVVNNFLKFKELSTEHRQASSLYLDIYHDIKKQMCLYRKDRTEAVPYINETVRKYDELNITCPDISSNIRIKFKKQFQHSDIAFPVIADTIQKIDIIPEIEEIITPPLRIHGDINEDEIIPLQALVADRDQRADRSKAFQTYAAYELGRMRMS